MNKTSIYVCFASFCGCISPATDKDGVLKTTPATCGYEKPNTGIYKMTALVPDAGTDTYLYNDFSLNLSHNSSTGLLQITFSEGIAAFFRVTCGTFSCVHGWGADGTECPTDGYIVSGTFTSATEIRGRHGSYYGCSLIRECDYVATLVLPLND